MTEQHGANRVEPEISVHRGRCGSAYSDSAKPAGSNARFQSQA